MSFSTNKTVVTNLHKLQKMPSGFLILSEMAVFKKRDQVFAKSSLTFCFIMNCQFCEMIILLGEFITDKIVSLQFAGTTDTRH